MIQPIQVLKKVWEAISGVFTEINERRILPWVLGYFLAVWKLLEPVIGLFDLSTATVELIRNIGIAFLPLVVIFTWFHGKPGTQSYQRKEALPLGLGLTLSMVLFWQLNQVPPQRYTLLAPFSRHETEWYEAHVLPEFEMEHNVDIVFENVPPDYQQALLTTLRERPDSSRLVLAYVPLYWTGLLLQDYRQHLLSFETAANPDQRAELTRLVASLDSTVVEYGRAHNNSDNDLYFLPAEFETPVMVGRSEMLRPLSESYRVRRSELEQAWRRVAGQPLPAGYQLEADVSRWDMLDVFAAAWLLRHAQADAEPGLVYACTREDILPHLADVALATGARFSSLFRLAGEFDGVQPEVTDVFFWEAMFREAGLYAEEMWHQGGLSQRETAEILRSGQAHLGFVSNRQLADLLAGDSQFVVGPLPTGSRTADTGSSGSGLPSAWFWCIPQSTPSTELSVALAEWLLSYPVQARLMRHVLQIPVRRDLLTRPTVEDSTYGRAMRVCLAQIRARQRSVPAINPFAKLREADFEILQQFYYRKWQEIVVGRGYRSYDATLQRETIAGLLMVP